MEKVWQNQRNTTKKFPGNCFFCGNKGHRQSDCKFKKKNEEVNSNKVNIVEERIEKICAMITDLQVGMITKTNMAATKSKDW